MKATPLFLSIKSVGILEGPRDTEKNKTTKKTAFPSKEYIITKCNEIQNSYFKDNLGTLGIVYKCTDSKFAVSFFLSFLTFYL